MHIGAIHAETHILIQCFLEKYRVDIHLDVSFGEIGRDTSHNIHSQEHAHDIHSNSKAISNVSSKLKFNATAQYEQNHKNGLWRRNECAQHTLTARMHECDRINTTVPLLLRGSHFSSLSSRFHRTIPISRIPWVCCAMLQQTKHLPSNR